MSILIKGMEMPIEGEYSMTLYVCSDGSAYLDVTSFPVDKDRFEAVPVPEPHGRLIDADALHKLFEAQWHYLQVLNWDENPTAEAKQTGVNWCINTLHDEAPTIIPASGGSET